MSERLAERARRAFEELHGREPERVAFAPGRVNLIGEHVDYNDGLVLPMTVERGVAAAASPRDDRTLDAWSELDGARHAVALDAAGSATSWMRYVAAVAAELAPARGADLAIVADLPAGAGLGSSAALDLAVLRALHDGAWDATAMAALARRADRERVGIGCGVMDHLASACGVADAALLIDCRSLAVEPVPLPDDVAVVVLDTGVRRELLGGEYDERRRSCERAAEALGVAALRDVDGTALRAAKERLARDDYLRAAHVVGEIERPRRFVEALRAREHEQAGRLMGASHASLRDLFGVSCDELDLVVDLARAHPAAWGARLTGAGFGGCAVALVRRADVHAFCVQVKNAYEERSGREGRAWPVTAVAGARLVD